MSTGLLCVLLCGASTAWANPSAGVVDVEAFVLKPVPINALTEQLIGAASQPEVAPAAVITALERVAAQRRAIASVTRRTQAAMDAVIREGAPARRHGKRLLKRVDAHEPLLGALEGASLRRASGTPLAGPLEGGGELGPDFVILGQLLGAHVLQSLAAREEATAAKAVVQLARFGVVVADSARTMDELTAGVRAAQAAFGLMARFPALARKVAPSATPEALQAGRRALGDYGQALQSARRQLKQAADLTMLSRIASTSSSALWRYEAFKVLRVVALTGSGTTRGEHAVTLLGEIAESPKTFKDVRERARRESARLRPDR